MMTCIVGIVAVAAMLSAGCAGPSHCRNGTNKGPGLVLQVKDVNGKVTEIAGASMKYGPSAEPDELCVTDGVASLFIPWNKISKVELLKPLASAHASYSEEITLTLQSGESRNYKVVGRPTITGQTDLGRYCIELMSVREVTNVSEKEKR